MRLSLRSSSSSRGGRISHTRSCAGLTLIIFALAMLLAALLINLASAPPPWFDEGWAMAVARNWVEYGHYGQMRSGMPASGQMLNMGWPVIGPIALSFQVFGVGLWQGRLPSALSGLVAFIALFRLARRLYDFRTAVASVIIAIVLSPYPVIHPLIVARWAAGEMPAACLMLLAYLALTASWRHPSIAFLAGSLMGLAGSAKLQVLPFAILALVIPAGLLMLAGRRKLAAPLWTALVALILSYLAASRVQVWLQSGQVPEFNTRDLLMTTGIAVAGPARVLAIFGFTLLAMPSAIAQVSVLRDHSRARRSGLSPDQLMIAKFSIAVFALSWLAWYLVFSIGWPRYLFLPVFLSTIAVAGLINKLTQGLRFGDLFRDAAAAFRRSSRRASFRALVTLALLACALALAVPTSLNVLVGLYAQRGSPAQQVADFINHDTAPGALIETYEMELFPLLRRPYHYPPDQIQLDLNRRHFMGQNVPIHYDPMDSDPDYLIVGPQAKIWGLYGSIVSSSSFRLIQRCGSYDVYARVR